ncbi:Protein wings apart-like [Papilio machaon]|uniref:Protein wings apart-like n=1 Tax=Papilio machaon TaxID=76193 RepID=A0A0N0PCW1_PAPMA|nr:Protein wings apart-like [Papilio machaon]
MSRWGRGRGGSVAVPLDSALFRENSNCPSAARSAGTVGKWGMTSFTSIRSAPYAYNNAKKPVQDQNSPLTVPAVDTEQPPPKPKKFFKSRNAETFPPVPQIAYAPQQVPPLSPEHPPSFKEKKSTKRCRYNRDSSSPELPRRNSEKTKTKKNTVATKASKKEEPTSDNSQPPNKRYLVRNRSKVINYAEDGSNSPIPDMTRYESLPSRSQSPKASPLISSPVPAKPVADVVSPSTSKESNEERKPPPIVLRISKGTSRIVSTDSNEGFTSPGSDRHSSMDMHSDLDHKKSPSMETICSPKHEGLKITIKCSSLSQENKKEKKKDKKEGHHKSHKRHHKNSDDEPLKKTSSPLPGTDTYDLYKTLASPIHEEESNSKIKADNVEAQLAKLISTNSTTKPKSESKAVLPEPKQLEGRSRRNRPNINYSENDDYLDVLTSKVSSKNVTKTVNDIKKDVRKSKRRLDVAATPDTNDMNEIHPETEKEAESHYDDNDLINILSGDNDKIDPTNDLQKAKFNKKQKNKHKQVNSTSDIQSATPEDSLSVPQLDESHDEDDEHLADEPRSDDIDYEDDGGVQEEKEGESQIEKALEHEERNHPSDVQSGSQIESQGIDSNEDHNTPTQSSDSAYNSCPNENSEEESQRNIGDHNFKAPNGVNELDGTDDKPSVKLVITKKKGSIFKSKSLVNDNPSPLPARKRRHLYRHQWANDKGNETPRPDRPENPEVSNPVRQVPEALTRVTRYRSPDPIIAEIDAAEPGVPYTSVRCAKEAKEYYTVVRNVKKAHQIQEIGEFQEFNDDVEYLLDALQDNNPMSTRCLSAITLASKCTAPAFRMHLRAHGTVQKFFSALHDATNDQSLGLCTATVMFVLSQDRLNMDLDRESLELMLNLLESDVSHKNALDDCGLTSAQLAKTQERVRELCAEIKSQGKATHLDLENITVGHLAMETLLSLTSKRAGEWFKEELRVLGGVDHIVRTIQDCAARLQAPATSWSSAEVDVLRKADRCMRVLENKGNETPRPDRPENPEVSNPVRQVPEALTRVTRYRSPDPIIAEIDATEPGVPYTSVRCAKEAKEYYTVVRNVKKAHQIQEIGEFQEFNDDVEYLLDALQDNNPMSTRCLSAITLASKCTAPAFRMHLRAHGTVQKFFSALHDATNDQSLGLCTATVMFVLSQDRLNMDLDRESLELMLNLLESDVSHKNALDDCGLTSAQLAKTQERVRELCAEIKSQGKATHLDLENITVGHLAMETLLSLTSKRAGEWFKEELRVLGGVDHIVRTIQDCAARLQAPATSWSSAEVDVLRKADRCMRVLENVTQQNEDNQVYLVGEPLGGARTLAALLRRCVMEARAQPALRPPLLDAALPALKVLVNLSHSFGSVASIGAQVVGEQPYIMETCLIMLNNQGCFIPDNNNFEFSVCVLLLLINLVQNNESNTQKLLDVHITVDNEDTSTNTPALDLIVDLFYKREELARRAEENTDALLDGEKEETDDEKDKKKQSVDDIAETVDKLLARAGAHMEHTMVCAYIALLLGHAASCARAPAAAVRARVPRYQPLLPTLRKYYTFLSLTASAEASIVAHVKATQRIIEFMETSDKETSRDPPQQPPAEYPRPYSNYYQPCADLPQDMSLSNLNYTMNSSSSSDRMSSSMEVDGYH